MSAPPRPNPLRSSRAFRRLWIARTLSHVGDGIAVVALVLLVQGSQRTGVAVGVLLLASSLPRFLGPLAGVVADRIQQRALMVGCDLGNAAIFLVIAGLEPSFPWLLGLVAASALLDTLFAPAGRSAIPALVEPEDLLRANAWMGTSLNLQVAAGTLLGGALVAGLGARGALAANALSFLLSAALLNGLPPLRAPTQGERRGFLAVGTAGLVYAWRTPAVRALVLALFLGVAFAAVDNVALVFLVRETLGGGSLAFGVVTAAYGVGMLAASIGLSWRPTTAAAGALLLLGWSASGAGTVLTGLAPLLAVAAVAQAVAGFGNGMENVAGDTLIQQVVPREMLGRVFGLVATAAFGRKHACLCGRGIRARPHLSPDGLPDRRYRSAGGDGLALDVAPTNPTFLDIIREAGAELVDPDLTQPAAERSDHADGSDHGLRPCQLGACSAHGDWAVDPDG